MEYSSEFENLNSGTAGVYRQNAFYIRMSSLFDLEPSEGEPLTVAVAMHAHEYVHFLHNASTTAGQAYLLSNLILLRALASGCDEQGYFLGRDVMSDAGRVWLNLNAVIMRAQLGATAVRQLIACKDVDLWKCSSPTIERSDGIPTATTVFSARDAADNPQNQSVTIGLSFITEGIAYEIEREMRRLGGTSNHDLDAQTRVFPYLAYRVLVRSWSGRELTAHDCIAIGVSALAHKFSGFWLATICLALKDTELPLDEVLKKARATCIGDSEHVMAKLREQRRDLRKGDAIWTAMGEYLTLAEAGAALRRKYWAPELEFVSRKLNPEEFRQCIAAMLDCLVIQGKPAGAVKAYWIGPGLIAQTGKTADCLGALQSALHFSQLHLRADGSAAPTTDLKICKIQCPFTGGCETERVDGYPSACKSAPWERFTPSRPGEKVCLYAAGVKGLRSAAGNSR